MTWSKYLRMQKEILVKLVYSELDKINLNRFTFEKSKYFIFAQLEVFGFELLQINK